MKYLTTYLRDYAFRYRDINELEARRMTEKTGEEVVYINLPILLNEAANRIEELQNQLYELRHVNNIIEIANKVGEKE